MHVARVAVLERAWDEEEKREKQEWLLGHWIAVRSHYHAQTFGKDIPQTKAEQKANEKKSHTAAIHKYQDFREEHDAEWIDVQRDPRYLGRLIGMPEILGPPPEEHIQTPEEARAEREEKVKRGHEAAFRAMRGIFGGD